MLKKILFIVIGSLAFTVISVAGVLIFIQRTSTIQSFNEQQNTLVKFAVDNVELGLSTGQMDAVRKTLGIVQSYSIFHGAILFDSESTPLLTIPENFEIPIMIKDKIVKPDSVATGKIAREEVSYETDSIKDINGEIIGYLMIAFTLEPLKKEIIREISYTSLLGTIILLLATVLVVWQITRIIKPLGEMAKAAKRIGAGDQFFPD